MVSSDYRDPTTVQFVGSDGAVAECRTPLGPCEARERFAGFRPDLLVNHVSRPLNVGVLLVRLGGYAAGVFGDNDRLLASKVGSRLVHSRHRKGGSSQARFARRRENEVTALIAAAADTAARVLLPHSAMLGCFIAGGDKRACEQVLQDRRLAPLLALRCAPFLTTTDPKRSVLEQSPCRYRSTQILLREEPTGS